MKIEVEDLDKIISVTGAEDSSGLRMVLARYLINIYDCGMDEGLMNRGDDANISRCLNCPDDHGECVHEVTEAVLTPSEPSEAQEPTYDLTGLSERDLRALLNMLNNVSPYVGLDYKVLGRIQGHVYNLIPD